MNIEELLGYEWDSELSEIREGCSKVGVLVDDSLSYQDGWYIYSKMTFDVEGKRYILEYKEHTSDNVSDFEWLMDSLICIGDVDKLDEMIPRSELEILKAQYEKALKNKNTEINNLKAEKKKALEPFENLSGYSKGFIDTLGKALIEAYNDESKSSVALKKVGHLLVDYSKMK